MNILYSCQTGSRLYGNATLSSDTDIRGFVLESPETVLGLNNFEQYESPSEDIVFYSSKKFIDLLKKGSPNVLELLFVPKEHVIVSTVTSDLLIFNKDLFVTKQIIPKFIGFSKSEKIKNNPKSKSHSIRMLEQLIELLQHKTITFPRPNADFLLEIKTKNIDNLEYENYYNNLLNKIRYLESSCNLPQNIDENKVNEIYLNIVAPSTISYLKEKQWLDS